MAIDPDLYEKYSGRKGDVYSRMGEALAQDAKRQSRRDETLSRNNVPMFLGMRGMLIRYVIDRYGVVGLLIVVAVFCGVLLWFVL